MDEGLDRAPRNFPVAEVIRQYALHVLGHLHVPMVMMDSPNYVKEFLKEDDLRVLTCMTLAIFKVDSDKHPTYGYAPVS